jgi:hypothetical protein
MNGWFLEQWRFKRSVPPHSLSGFRQQVKVAPAPKSLCRSKPRVVPKRLPTPIPPTTSKKLRDQPLENSVPHGGSVLPSGKKFTCRKIRACINIPYLKYEIHACCET